MSRQPLRAAITAAAETLAAVGVPTPRVDAELLAAHLLGVARTGLLLVPMVDAAFLDAYRVVVAQRCKRIPLQYITGIASRGDIDVEVGPGVFVPRPETELLLAWALGFLEQAGHGHAPVVVELCAGTAALALAIAHARPDAQVHAVELDPHALEWAQRNLTLRASAGDNPISVHAGDVTDPATLAALNGTVDVIVANPPYIPTGTQLEPEVAEHDPDIALFAGDDGLAVIRAMAPTVARLLRPGGAAAVEHDDSNGAGTVAALRAAGLTGAAEHQDLAGRPRFVTALAPR